MGERRRRRRLESFANNRLRPAAASSVVNGRGCAKYGSGSNTRAQRSHAAAESNTAVVRAASTAAVPAAEGAEEEGREGDEVGLVTVRTRQAGPPMITPCDGARAAKQPAPPPLLAAADGAAPPPTAPAPRRCGAYGAAGDSKYFTSPANKPPPLPLVLLVCGKGGKGREKDGSSAGGGTPVAQRSAIADRIAKAASAIATHDGTARCLVLAPPFLSSCVFDGALRSFVSAAKAAAMSSSTQTRAAASSQCLAPAEEICEEAAVSCVSPCPARNPRCASLVAALDRSISSRPSEAVGAVHGSAGRTSTNAGAPSALAPSCGEDPPILCSEPSTASPSPSPSSRRG